MKRSPLLATTMVIAFLVGVPVALIRRLNDGLLPTQAYDIVLGVGVVAWILISKAILERDTPMSTLVENRLSPSWQAHHLVEQSAFGVGFVPRKRRAELIADARLFQLGSPYTPIDALLPPAVPTPVQEPTPGRDRPRLDGVGRPRLQPTIHRPESTAPPILATEEYVLGRGDTLWSIAELRLGDGREWTTIEQINIGREVADGVIYDGGDAVRIGWSILVPMMLEVGADG